MIRKKDINNKHLNMQSVELVRLLAAGLISGGVAIVVTNRKIAKPKWTVIKSNSWASKYLNSFDFDPFSPFEKITKKHAIILFQRECANECARERDATEMEEFLKWKEKHNRYLNRVASHKYQMYFTEEDRLKRTGEELKNAGVVITK